MDERERSIIAGLSVVGGGRTHAGNVRTSNEDTFVIGHGIYVVADGMGGHAAGDVASRLAADTIAAPFAADLVAIDAMPGLIQAANDTIREHAAGTDRMGMGTTIVGVAATRNGPASSFVVFHLGDSRCYSYSDDELVLLTRDHSHVQELVDRGEITASDALTHPMRNVVTRALGVDDIASAEYRILDAGARRLLLCSDGLTELSDDTIARVLGTAAEPQEAADRLLETVLAGRAADNVTAVVLDIEQVGVPGSGDSQPTPPTDAEITRPTGRRLQIER